MKTTNKVLVKVGATWCKPCKNLDWLLSHQENLEVDEIQFIDTDESPEIIKELGIKSVPTLILYLDGTEIKRRTGSMLRSDLEKWVNE